jgi:hypothetical protein
MRTSGSADFVISLATSSALEGRWSCALLRKEKRVRRWVVDSAVGWEGEERERCWRARRQAAEEVEEVDEAAGLGPVVARPLEIG